MPHIHTETGQHDHTASAYIVRLDFDEPKLMLHRHRLFGKYLQFGGHIELDETPWQTLAHEIEEESDDFIFVTREELMDIPSEDMFEGSREIGLFIFDECLKNWEAVNTADFS